jgi:hypothetical protein
MVGEDVTRLIKLLSLTLALVASFLVCDTTIVLAQSYGGTGSNHTMNQNSMSTNSTNSSAMMTPKTNETLGVAGTVNVTKNTTPEVNQTANVTKSKTVDPPLRQLKNGVSVNDIKCISGMQLILKKEDSSPACVKPEDATKLMERGWGYAP